MILAIETATDVCSVALGNGAEVNDCIEEKNENIHSTKLTVFIEKLIKKNKVSPNELTAVVVGKGPGSYTGLRIGVSVAKGMAYSLDIPLLGISTLESLAHEVIIKKNQELNALYCPMIDARRMEVYTALYHHNLKEEMPVTAIEIDEKSFSDTLQNNKIYFFGNGMPKCKLLLSAYPNACFENDIILSAKNLIPLAKRYLNDGKTENIFTFEPAYLKEFNRFGKA